MNGIAIPPEIKEPEIVSSAKSKHSSETRYNVYWTIPWANFSSAWNKKYFNETNYAYVAANEKTPVEFDTGKFKYRIICFNDYSSFVDSLYKGVDEIKYIPHFIVTSDKFKKCFPGERYVNSEKRIIESAISEIDGMIKNPRGYVDDVTENLKQQIEEMSKLAENSNPNHKIIVIKQGIDNLGKQLTDEMMAQYDTTLLASALLHPKVMIIDRFKQTNPKFLDSCIATSCEEGLDYLVNQL